MLQPCRRPPIILHRPLVTVLLFVLSLAPSSFVWSSICCSLFLICSASSGGLGNQWRCFIFFFVLVTFVESGGSSGCCWQVQALPLPSLSLLQLLGLRVKKASSCVRITLPKIKNWPRIPFCFVRRGPISTDSQDSTPRATTLSSKIKTQPTWKSKIEPNHDFKENRNLHEPNPILHGAL